MWRARDLAWGCPPCFCVSAGQKGVTGEWTVSAGVKGVREFLRKGGQVVASRFRMNEGAEGSEGHDRLACLKHDGTAYHDIY
jgi:hypothetical protein